ncbi:hypothetical protein M3P21_06350 [Ruegeria sp. 2012CJ41-6]|uniref:DUF4157 domain-containing protein n=1 Tax=Ruegeria spongiae TaxID=2942209 RepID=A0ABT0PZT9_9RHOB|nr:hypothetical protein [Ruegeria spongiae]MCL6283149.1 hypothetical protein [Ruegeria spongiae]
MFPRLLVILFLVVACGRPLTETEMDFAGRIHGDALDLNRVRVVEGAPVGSVTFRRKPRPRVTCRERILPPVKDELVTSKPAAVALFNHVLFTRDWYLEDYTPEFPDHLALVQAMLFAHELTHVWQWQNRRTTGYHPLRAAAEHGGADDPYLFDLEKTPEFLDYGFEQQGAIVEEYVCCRALDPDAARTKRLHRMLSAAFPVSTLPKTRESDVYLPWDGVEIDGICD